MAHDPLGTLDLTNVKVEPFANPGSRGNFGLNKAHYTRVSGPLFPSLPSAGDIKQQELADCYVLAAVLAILARDGGAETVEGMMRDRGADVVVRLHDAKGTPRYVAIEKSIRRNSEKHNGGAIWATLLEKAYAAASFVEEGKKFAEGGKTAAKDAPVVTGWAKLNFGSSTEAFQVLLGTKGDDAQTIDALISGQGNDGMQFRYLFSVETTAKMHESVRANLRDKIFNGSQQSLDRFLLWRTIHVQKAWRTLLEANGEIATDTSSQKDTPRPTKSMRLEDLSAFLTANGLSADVANDILDFAATKQLMPGRRGTGVYSTAQLAAFKRIKDALDARKPVTLGTRQSVGTAISAKGKSGGEAIVKGLAASHAYAVLSIREEAAPPNRKWVRIRNPWGEKGRAYVPSATPNVLKAVETNDAEFDLELSDVTKRFERIYIAGVAITA